MPGLTRVGDLESGHDGYEPVRLATGSPNVFINGRRAGRVGDVYEAHGGHRDVITSGSPSIFINGRPAARIGDSVAPAGSFPRGTRAAGDAGGAAQEGSETVLTVTMDQYERAMLLSYWNRVANILPKNPDETEKTILALPEIAEAEAGRAAQVINIQGWSYLSAMFRKWLAGNASDDKDAVEPFYVSMNWVLSFPRAREDLQDLENRLFNEPAKVTLAEEIISMMNGKDRMEFDLFTKKPIGKLYFQSAPSDPDLLKMIILGSFGAANGIDAALARFSFRALASGTIEKIGPGEYEITVTKAGAVLWDQFDFKGEQPLGVWNRKTKQFASLGMGVYLNNAAFRKFSADRGIGQDFFVSSDVHYFSLQNPVIYRYKKVSGNNTGHVSNQPTMDAGD